MTIFDGQRLRSELMKLDVEGLRRGYYSDKYFENVVRVLHEAHEVGYRFGGESPRALPPDADEIDIGDMVVEAQWFNRRAPRVLVAGMDVALAILRAATGYFADDRFVETWDALEVEALQDGAFTHYDGDPLHVQPVMKIRGRYRDFALLETTILGVLSRASRIATNVYEVLGVANGKPVLYFPARFDVLEVQQIDGYAYWLAVQRYNHDHPNQQQMQPLVSTQAQGAWWGGQSAGTVPHALIACFLADTAEAMEAYARFVPVGVRRIALVDFNNDTIGASLATLNTYWPHYRAALEAGDSEGQQRWTLDGVRLDTSKNVRDVALNAGDPGGISPKLVRLVRTALDEAWLAWDVPEYLREIAQQYCRKVQIVVTGGFDRERIQQYEAEGVPVDVYGVGSSFLVNDAATNTDYTMDVVRVKLGDTWVDMAKVGRQPVDNPELERVEL